MSILRSMPLAERFTAICYDLGNFLRIPVAMLLLSLPVCAISGEWMALAAFSITLLSVLVISYLCYWQGHPAQTGPIGQTLVSVWSWVPDWWV